MGKGDLHSGFEVSMGKKKKVVSLLHLGPPTLFSKIVTNTKKIFFKKYWTILDSYINEMT